MPPRKRTSARPTAAKKAAPRRTTKKAAPRRTVATKAPAAAPQPPVVPPGQRLYILTVPFEERAIANANGAKWDKHHRQTVYIGADLPRNLHPYRAQDHSWERYLEDRINGTSRSSATTVFMTPRPHQSVAADKIVASARKGWRGFIEADDVGLGKTLASLQGAVQVARLRKETDVLVLCPKGVIDHWRRTIAATDTTGLNIVVINYDQQKKLLQLPDTQTPAKKTRTQNKRYATSGQPTVQWGVILADESHKLKNESQRRAMFSRIARYSAPAQQAPFVIWMSATIGQDPTDLGYLTPLLAQMTKATKTELRDYGQWLASNGFFVEHNARFDKWEWGKIPDDTAPSDAATLMAWKERDLKRIHGLLFQAEAPSIRRLPTDIAGWPEIHRILHPVTLSVTQHVQYEQAWTQFRRDFDLARRGKDPVGGMAARTRFRQKASLLRAEGTAELAKNLVDNGHQVAIRVEYHESTDAIVGALNALGVASTEFTGRCVNEREANRFAFQRGEVPVILFSVLEGISLHQGEELGGGDKATANPRTTLVHDARYSGLDAIQIEGRCHRDGKAANVYYLYSEGTVEEEVVSTLVHRVLSAKTMVGDDTKAVRLLTAVFDKVAATVTGPKAGSSSGPEEGLAPANRRRPPSRPSTRPTAAPPDDRRAGAPAPAPVNRPAPARTPPTRPAPRTRSS